MNDKTHYRKVFKSDHLGSADIEDFKENGSDLIFTISHVAQEIGTKVAGKKIDANVAYFKEAIKPMVLNATNSKIMSKLTKSSFVEDWRNVTVQLYIDANVMMKGEVVGGVRINPNPVRPKKPVITKASASLWTNATNAYKRDGNFKAVLERADISKADMDLIIKECSDEV